MKVWSMTIYGRVQGVCYRNTVSRRVTEILPMIQGYIKNNFDGTVEVIAKGSEADLNELIQLCKEGSNHSNVKEVKFSEIKDHHNIDFHGVGFKVLRF